MRRYNTRQSRDYYDGPMTRSMKTRLSEGGGGDKGQVNYNESELFKEHSFIRTTPRKVKKSASLILMPS